MSAYPVTYEADYAERRNRLTVFFRMLLVIPHVIVLYLVGFAAMISVFISWFAVVITGRYPEGLYRFNVGALQWLSRVSAYMYLQTDAYPPFGFGEHEEYPVHIRVAPPLPAYSRLKAFFRLILAIPVGIIQYALGLVAAVCAIAGWFVAVITGRMPRAIFDGLDLGLAYTTKATAYFWLLTETWPPFSNSNQGGLVASPTGSGAIGASGTWAPPTGVPEGLEHPAGER